MPKMILNTLSDIYQCSGDFDGSRLRNWRPDIVTDIKILLIYCHL